MPNTPIFKKVNLIASVKIAPNAPNAPNGKSINIGRRTRVPLISDLPLAIYTLHPWSDENFA